MKESVVTNPRDALERDSRVTESVVTRYSVTKKSAMTVMMLTICAPNVIIFYEILSIFIR